MNVRPEHLCTFELVMSALYGTDAEREASTAEIFCRIANQYTPVEFDNFTKDLDDFLMGWLNGRPSYKAEE